MFFVVYFVFFVFFGDMRIAEHDGFLSLQQAREPPNQIRDKVCVSSFRGDDCRCQRFLFGAFLLCVGSFRKCVGCLVKETYDVIFFLYLMYYYIYNRVRNR